MSYEAGRVAAHLLAEISTRPDPNVSVLIQHSESMPSMNVHKPPVNAAGSKGAPTSRTIW
jgi:hypothetical protein